MKVWFREDSVAPTIWVYRGFTEFIEQQESKLERNKERVKEKKYWRPDHDGGLQLPQKVF
jgi:hypothetical protein